MKLLRIVMVMILIAGMVILIMARGTWNENIAKHARADSEATVPQPKKQKDEMSTDTEVTDENIEMTDFYQRLSNQEISRIKLVGDNITAGAGLPGYTTQGGDVIFDAYGEVHREAGRESPSWANQLRDYLSDPAFGEVELINAGITDKTAAWVLNYLPDLIDQQEDVVILMIGTDDRINSSIEEFEVTMRELTSSIAERTNQLILVSPPPSTQELYDYNYTMAEADMVLKEIAMDNDYLFLSQFDAINQELAEQGLPYEQLMNTENANPTEQGHAVMWRALADVLGLQ